MELLSIDNDEIKEIRKELKKILDKKRYHHTMGVAYTAASLAMAHSENVYNAFLAGLLHDNAKCIGHDKKIDLCKKYGLKINSAEKSNPDLLHAKLGGVLAKEKYGITNDEICSAICYHTTGKPDMTTLEKIIYIADYIEPGRKPLKNIEEIRRVSFENLNKGMKLILKNTISYLEEKGSNLDTLTLETYEFYKN